MTLAIDIGGTKTLMALCTKDKKIITSQKFSTPKNYSDFKVLLKKAIKDINGDYDIVVVAVPGKLDRKQGSVIEFGNLPWKNIPISNDIYDITGKKVLIENDANMASLYASHSVKPLPHKALYITISTGIGTGFVVDGVLDPDLLDSEGGHILIEYGNQFIDWEHISSGKSIVEKYGKRASEIDDPKMWNEISKNFALGIVDLCAVLDPDIILIGGGVGTHFKKYESFLIKHVKELLPRLVDMPKIMAAPNAEEAVIYGCSILASQHANK
jgi:predicted NBD/HSP70 family sugar kinase